MVLWYQAAVSPGKVRLPGAARLCTTTTSTVGRALPEASVSRTRPRSACTLMKWTTRNASSSVTATAAAARCNVRPESLGSKGISWVRSMMRRRMPGSQQSIHGGYEHQCCKGGEQQSADDCARQRSVLLATLAQSQGHGNHAQDHCAGGHQHRAQAGEAGAGSGGRRIIAGAHSLVGESHYQDAVGSSQAD